LIVEPNLALLSKLKIFPGGDEKIEAIYRGSLLNLDLQTFDYMTIRDLASFEDAADDVLHVLLISMCISLNEGSLCLRLEKEALSNQIQRFVGDTAGEYAEKVLNHLERNRYPSLVSADITAFMPLIHTDGYLFFQKYLKSKLTLEKVIDHLLDRSSAAVPPVGLPRMEKALQQVLVDDPILLEGKPVHFNDGQKLALAAALLKNFVVISGGPGTGKTSIIIAILRSFIRCGVPADRIYLAAPTGRAAQRITESVQAGLKTIAAGETGTIDNTLSEIGASTIHRLLRYKRARDSFTYNRNNLLPADVLIVDEISMVDVVLMTRLMESVKKDAHIIFLGDKNQLPSVNAGTVLADFIPQSDKELALCYSRAFENMVGAILPELDVPACDGTNRMIDRIVVLTESYRSGKTIQKIADTIIRPPHGKSVFAEVLNMVPVMLPEGHLQQTYGMQGRFLPVVFRWPESENGQKGGKELEGSCQIISGDQQDIPCTPPASAQECELAYWRGVIYAWLDHAYLKAGPGHPISYEDLAAQLAGCDFSSIEAATGPEKSLGALFNILSNSRILTLVRKSRFGCIWINRFAGECLKPLLDPDNGGSFFHGMPILMTSNDYTRDLFNGDVGIVLRGKGREHRAVFPRADGYATHHLDTLNAWEPAFSITVHKSQGSEYEHVFLVLPEDPDNRLLTREMIYTALTRAKSLAVIYGKKSVLKRAVEQRIIRESGIRIWEG
jgi:exodeoxyribonuclease V alpha subunit